MKLTAKQQRFCDEYLIDLNATQAAIRAGYSEDTARSQGQRLLTNVDVQDYISEQQAIKAKEIDISKNRVLNELAKIAFGDVRNYFDELGRLINLQDLQTDVSASIKSVTVQQERFVKDGENFVETSIKKIEAYDKTRALDMLNKMLGFYVPIKQEHSGAISTFGSPEEEKDFKEFLRKKYQFK